MLKDTNTSIELLHYTEEFNERKNLLKKLYSTYKTKTVFQLKKTDRNKCNIVAKIKKTKLLIQYSRKKP